MKRNHKLVMNHHKKRYGQFTKRYIQSPGSIADSTLVSSTSSIMSSESQGDSVLVSNVRGWTQTGTSTYNKILKYLSTIRNQPEQIKMEEDLLTEIIAEMTDNQKKKCEFDNNETVEVEEAMDAYNMNFEAV